MLTIVLTILLKWLGMKVFSFIDFYQYKIEGKPSMGNE